jgi:hypothetical protein
MPIFLVNTLSTFRCVYAIEAETLEHAFDELVMTEHARPFDEVTTRWLGETILDGREVTSDQLKQAMESYKQDKNEMCSFWMEEKLVHKVNYEDSTGE